MAGSRSRQPPAVGHRQRLRHLLPLGSGRCSSSGYPVGGGWPQLRAAPDPTSEPFPRCGRTISPQFSNDVICLRSNGRGGWHGDRLVRCDGDWRGYGRRASCQLARSGLSVVLLEKELASGECSYWGCVPSKTHIRRPAACWPSRSMRGSGSTHDDVFGERFKTVSEETFPTPSARPNMRVQSPAWLTRRNGMDHQLPRSTIGPEDRDGWNPI